MEELKAPQDMTLGEKRQWIVDAMFELAYNAYYEKGDSRVLKDLVASFTQLLPALKQIADADISEKISASISPIASGVIPITSLEISQQISEIYRLVQAEAIPISQATEKLEMLSLMARTLRDLPVQANTTTLGDPETIKKVCLILERRVEAPLRHVHAWHDSLSRAMSMKVIESKHVAWLAADVAKLMNHAGTAEKFHSDIQRTYFQQEVNKAKEFALDHKPKKS